eukprot:1041778-Prymnesium_polylepis.2
MRNPTLAPWCSAVPMQGTIRRVRRAGGVELRLFNGEESLQKQRKHAILDWGWPSPVLLDLRRPPTRCNVLRPGRGGLKKHWNKIGDWLMWSVSGVWRLFCRCHRRNGREAKVKRYSASCSRDSRVKRLRGKSETAENMKGETLLNIESGAVKCQK